MGFKSICEPGGGGWFLPIYEGQLEWPSGLHGLVCALTMIYSFLGVAVVSDAFMASIEAITCRRQQQLLENGRYTTSMVWNETVATLSLMALGSSAPEIFLSVMDLFKKEFHFAPLGASTIVGSAAFNLLVIVAVCIAAIPSNEVRRITDLPAFYVTAIFSIVAYVWLVLILVVVSPAIVDLWESIVTLLLLPLLIWISYKVNVGHCDHILDHLGLLPQAEEEKQVEDKPTILCFSTENQIAYVDATSEAQTLEVSVKIENLRGEADCAYRTEALSAVPDYDFEPVEGRLEFKDGCAEQQIVVPILPGCASRPVRKLVVILDDPVNASFNPDDDGGEDAAILSVIIRPPSSGSSSSSFQLYANKVMNLDSLKKGFAEWPQQFVEAVYCLGSAEAQAEASTVEWVQHVLALPWKVMWAFIPPTIFLGGWACFFAALLGIAIMSAFVSDVSDMFGCVLGVPDIVTAITFVALGTSMPDLFASLTAARDDPTADAAIVNVTGSNSVNVFLGLGLPWTCGTIYWAMTGRTAEWEARYPEISAQVEGVAFVVDSQNLGFSVLVFIAACIVALVLLYFRRKCVGGELGGNYQIKVASCTCFVGLWLGFIAVCSWKVLRYQYASAVERWLFILVAVLVMFAFASWPFTLLILHWRQHQFRRMSVLAQEEEAAQKSLEDEDTDPPPDKDSKAAAMAGEGRSVEEMVQIVTIAEAATAAVDSSCSPEEKPGSAPPKTCKDFARSQSQLSLSCMADVCKEPEAAQIRTIPMSENFSLEFRRYSERDGCEKEKV